MEFAHCQKTTLARMLGTKGSANPMEVFLKHLSNLYRFLHGRLLHAGGPEFKTGLYLVEGFSFEEPVELLP